MSDIPLATRPLASPVVAGLRAAVSATITIATLAWAADLYRRAGLIFLTEQFLAVILGLALFLVFIHYPLRRGDTRATLPWYDALIGAVGLIACLYTAWSYQRFSSEFFEMPADLVVVSWILVALCIEGLRRSAGWSLVIIVLGFCLYAMVGHLVPGSLQTRQVELNRFVAYLGIDSSGLFGLVLQVGITVVVPFVFFGSLLSASGGGAFFNDLAIALMGRYRGGAAKIAITASGLFGSISGIVVSNIMATGVITIPMMKRSGFTPRQAAAIEASASNGGQLMPPVMGAVAFLMADFLQAPYRDVAIAAFVPALLYYIALFIQADLDAAKLGVKRVPEADIPRIGDVLRKGWPYALPFAVLVYVIFWMNQEAEVSAFWASLVTLALGLTWGYDGRRMDLAAVWRCIVETGLGALDIFMISAAAGFIMGMLQITGLGFALTLWLVQLGQGNIVALLVIAALMCIVLGMGMPTLGVYVLLAVLIAPSLVEVGIPPMAAHLFILYLGMMSMVTPPVAIAAFFAASLAGSEPMRTGFTAMRFSWPAYVVPFLFVFSPSLLLMGDSLLQMAIAIATAIVGVWLASAGMVGYSFRVIGWGERIALIAAGFALLVPPDLARWAMWVNLAGVAAAVALLGSGYVAGKKTKMREPAAAG